MTIEDVQLVAEPERLDERKADAGARRVRHVDVKLLGLFPVGERIATEVVQREVHLVRVLRPQAVIAGWRASNTSPASGRGYGLGWSWSSSDRILSRARCRTGSGNGTDPACRHKPTVSRSPSTTFAQDKQS
jgi:hypothetical protein